MKTTRTITDYKAESLDVKKWQKTNDQELYEAIILNRIPTLKHWSRKCYRDYMDTTIDDLQQDLTLPLIKAINTYKYDKGTFNTYLYRLLSNHMANIVSSRFQKKRVHQGLYSVDAPAFENDDPETVVDGMEGNIPDEMILNNTIENVMDLFNFESKEAKDWLYNIAHGEKMKSNINMRRELHSKRSLMKTHEWKRDYDKKFG